VQSPGTGAVSIVIAPPSAAAIRSGWMSGRRASAMPEKYSRVSQSWLIPVGPQTW
jgi:hypothetical protein